MNNVEQIIGLCTLMAIENSGRMYAGAGASKISHPPKTKKVLKQRKKNKQSRKQRKLRK